MCLEHTIIEESKKVKEQEYHSSELEPSLTMWAACICLVECSPSHPLDCFSLSDMPSSILEVNLQSSGFYEEPRACGITITTYVCLHVFNAVHISSTQCRLADLQFIRVATVPWCGVDGRTYNQCQPPPLTTTIILFVHMNFIPWSCSSWMQQVDK